MDTANDAVILINGDSVIQSLNGTFTDVFGYTADDLVGKKINVIMPRRYADHHEGYVRRYLDTGESHILGTIREVEALHKDGHEFPVELSMSEMIIGSEHFFVGMLRNISARKDMEAALRKQRSKTLALLRNMLPPRIAQRLMDSPNESIADRCENVTILFADLAGFTPLAGSMDAGALVSLLNAIFSEFDVLAAQYQVEKIKTIGDAIMCAAGLRDTTERPMSADGGADVDGGSGLERMARMALEMHGVVEQRKDAQGRPLKLRIGIHHGVVVAGVIGKKKFLFDLWGDDVNIASRLESSGVPGKTQVSKEVYDRLKDSRLFTFDMQAYLLSTGPAFRRLKSPVSVNGGLGRSPSMSAQLTSINKSIVSAWQELRSVAMNSDNAAFSEGLPSPRAAAKPTASRRHKARRETILRLDLASISVFDLREEDGAALFRRLVEDLELHKTLGLDLNMVEELAAQALADHRDVPYHNRLHAMDVSLTTHSLLKSCKALPSGSAAGTAADAEQHLQLPNAVAVVPEFQLTEIDRLALMLAAVCHDLDHPGLLAKRPDPQTPTSYDAAAKLEKSFRDRPQSRKSLEAHHANRCVELLERHLRAIAPSLIDSEILHIQKIALEGILDTNMEIHEDFMSRFKQFFALESPRKHVHAHAGAGAGAGTPGRAAIASHRAELELDAGHDAHVHAGEDQSLSDTGVVAAGAIMQHLNVDAGSTLELELEAGRAYGHVDEAERQYAGRQLLCGAILKVADLGNAARPFADARRWARRIVLELGLASAAGTGGEATTLSPDADLSAEGPLADEALAGPQDSFLRGVALPLFETVARILPEGVRPMLERATVNADAWRSLKGEPNSN
eukprot:tig00021441_g21544.t1